MVNIKNKENRGYGFDSGFVFSTVITQSEGGAREKGEPRSQVGVVSAQHRYRRGDGCAQCGAHRESGQQDVFAKGA